MKGTAIGTIMPWAGDLGELPVGWLKCDGTTLDALDYPYLFEVIGYQYGGSGNSFVLPRLNAKALVDYHPSHQNIIGIGMSNNFRSRIGVNEANLTSGTVSNIDLRVSLSPRSNMQASVTELGINNPSYQETVSTVPRLLGDHHTPNHGHPGSFNSIGAASQWVEDCQGNTFTNCLLGCPDSCSNIDFYPMEANNSSTNLCAYVSPFITGSGFLGRTINPSAGGPADNNDANGQLEESNNPNRNWIPNEADCIEASNQGSGGYFGYPATLNHNGINFVGNTAGHVHDSTDFQINIGSVRTPNTINIVNISSSQVAPINDATKDIASIRVDNIDTPSLSLIHIIRAF